MNIYFCREKDEYAGLFVVAPTRGVAKAVFAEEMDCPYIDARAEIRRKDVDEFMPRCLSCLDEEDSLTLERYGLEYEELEW